MVFKLPSREETERPDNALKTSNLNVACDVPQRPILISSFFALYKNDLYKVSNILEPIMFADNTNVFFSHKSIK